MDRRLRSSSNVDGSDLPLGVSPLGIPINSVENLPDLPTPRKVIVGADALLVDGWSFRLRPISKKMLEWIYRQATRWSKEDPSPESRAQVFGIVEAAEIAIWRKSHPPEKEEV